MKFIMKSKVTKVENKAGGGHVVHIESVADGSTTTVISFNITFYGPILIKNRLILMSY